MESINVVCLSNINSNHIPKREMPEGDILIIAGGATNRGTHSEYVTLQENLGEIDSLYHQIIYVPGKQDSGIYSNFDMYNDMLMEAAKVVILVNDDVHVLGLNIWGSPVTPHDTNWVYTEKEKPRENIFGQIPSDIDIIVTACPPKGILDKVRTNKGTHASIGCESIRRHSERVSPKLHIFGGAFESYGHGVLEGVTYINAAYVNNKCEPPNEIKVVTVK